MLLSPRLRRTEGAPHKERETETTGVPSFSLSLSLAVAAPKLRRG